MFDLADFLKQMDRIRQRTRRVAECIPEEHLEWAYKPDAFTPGDLVRHIAVTERYVWAETVRGRPLAYISHGRQLANGKTAVLAFLDRLHEESIAILHALTPDDLERKVQTPEGSMLTAWRWLRLMPEHEIHHRGQLYTLLGFLGVQTPSLYGMKHSDVVAKSRAL